MTLHDPAATRQPRPPAPLSAPTVDLDSQIEQLERRLVEREAWLRSSAQSLAQRAQQAVAPRAWLLPALCGGAALWLGWRWLHHRSPALPVRVALPVHVTVRRGELLADLPWAGLVALGWPLLPMAWRARFSPATATAVASTGLSIVRRLFGRRPR
jgi:hypothetical protein